MRSEGQAGRCGASVVVMFVAVFGLPLAKGLELGGVAAARVFEGVGDQKRLDFQRVLRLVHRGLVDHTPHDGHQQG